MSKRATLQTGPYAVIAELRLSPEPVIAATRQLTGGPRPKNDHHGTGPAVPAVRATGWRPVAGTRTSRR
jgi:hypothetical protein